MKLRTWSCESLQRGVHDSGCVAWRYWVGRHPAVAPSADSVSSVSDVRLRVRAREGFWRAIASSSLRLPPTRGDSGRAAAGASSQRMRQAGGMGIRNRGSDRHRSGRLASGVVWAVAVIAIAVLVVESIKAVERFRLRRLRRHRPRQRGERPAMYPKAHREAPPHPAGIGDTPPLSVERLDPGAWAVLCWRQEHLPLGRIRDRADWSLLSSLEMRAAWRLADRLKLDDDHRYSLRHHHRVEVDRRAKAAAPDHVETWEEFRAQAQTRPSGPFALSLESRQSMMSPLDRWWERNMPMWWAGWPTWFRARRRELRERWFWLVTLPDYSGAPRVGRQAPWRRLRALRHGSRPGDRVRRERFMWDHG